MTREEQIKKAAHDFSWGWCDDKAHPLNDGFIEGAKWADPDTIDWQQVRIQASIAALNGITSSGSFEQHTLEDVIAECMILADALIAELKKGGNNEDN